MLLILFLVAGIVTGLLLGGRIDELGRVRLTWARLALAGLLVQFVLFSSPVAERIGTLGPPVYVGSTVAVLVALARNIRRPGLALLAAGAALNLVVVAANGGYMPVAPDALAALGHSPDTAPGAAASATASAADAAELAYGNTIMVGEGTALRWLGDVVPIPGPGPFHGVVSVGDVLIGFGAAVFLVRSMRPDPRR
jgi:hypothetical protein